jgi:hypothetical protein
MPGSGGGHITSCNPSRIPPPSPRPIKKMGMDWIFRRMASGVDEREKNSPRGISSDI